MDKKQTMNLEDKHKLTILQALEDQSKKQPVFFNITSDQNNALNSVPIEIRKELCVELNKQQYIKGDDAKHEYEITVPGLNLRYFLKLQEDQENANMKIASLTAKNYELNKLLIILGVILSIGALGMQVASFFKKEKKESLSLPLYKIDTTLQQLPIQIISTKTFVDSLKGQVRFETERLDSALMRIHALENPPKNKK